jgi:hypothetical protein
VADADQRFEGVLTGIDQNWAKHVDDSIQLVTAARREVASQYEATQAVLEAQLAAGRAERLELAQDVAARDRALQQAEATVTELEKRADAQVHNARAEAQMETQGQVDLARVEAEKGWSELVELLQTQADEAHQSSVDANRRSAEFESRIHQAETEQLAILERLATEGSSSDECAQLRLDLQTLQSQVETFERDKAAAVATAALDAEQKTLEDVEGMIGKLEQDSESLRNQLAEARRLVRKTPMYTGSILLVLYHTSVRYTTGPSLLTP